MHQLLVGYLAELPTILDSFYWVCQYYTTPIELNRVEPPGSYVASKDYVNTENSKVHDQTHQTVVW